MHHSHVMANCAAESAYELGALVATRVKGQIQLLAGPRLGLVMLNVRDSVAERQFFAGEILVTEVTVDVAGQFGFGMIVGNDPRRALASALVDAALARSDDLAAHVVRTLDALAANITQSQRELYRLASTSKVDFTVF